MNKLNFNKINILNSFIRLANINIFLNSNTINKLNI